MYCCDFVFSPKPDPRIKICIAYLLLGSWVRPFDISLWVRLIYIQVHNELDIWKHLIWRMEHMVRQLMVRQIVETHLSASHVFSILVESLFYHNEHLNHIFRFFAQVITCSQSAGSKRLKSSWNHFNCDLISDFSKTWLENKNVWSLKWIEWIQVVFIKILFVVCFNQRNSKYKISEIKHVLSSWNVRQMTDKSEQNVDRNSSSCQPSSEHTSAWHITLYMQIWRFKNSIIK